MSLRRIHVLFYDYIQFLQRFFKKPIHYIRQAKIGMGFGKYRLALKECYIERGGLTYDKGLLCIIDGAKGFRKAIQEVFGAHGIVQRCQWHKRENVVDYLKTDLQPVFRDKMRRAYSKESYGEAKSAFQTIKKELKLINASAVGSLEEGFEETLTLHRLGIAKEFRKSFSTTNMIESVNALIGQRTDKVDRWRNSDQKQRWVATALLDIERRLNRVNGYRHLSMLRAALQREVQRVNYPAPRGGASFSAA